MKPSVLLPVLLAGLGVLAAAGAARAQFLTQSPGPLARVHEDLEGQDKCDKCHPSGKELSNQLCLDCHDHADQKAKIAARRGYHSSTQVAGQKCWNCHSDHRGKNFDLMGWGVVGGKAKFNHDLTDYPLGQGTKHGALKCEECHKRKNKQGLQVFLGEKDNCGGSSCHRDDSPHKSEKAELFLCERCHTLTAWKPSKRKLDFNHNDPKQAAYVLEGTHASVACAKCHPKGAFRLVGKDVKSCATCHPSPHDGHLFGDEKKHPCDGCHSPKLGSLRDYDFDHDRRTKFKLDGKHRPLAKSCYGCHAKKVTTVPGKACEGCHARDSRHGNRFDGYGGGPPCHVCHPTSSWEPTAFNHDRRTQFQLEGAHREAGCRDCHRGKGPADFERFDPVRVGCMGCHTHAEVHKKQYTDRDCTTCHLSAGRVKAPEGLKEKFHGPRSDFPLRFGHTDLACVKCHKDDKWKGLSPECIGCHEDSLHRGSLGKTCNRCHAAGIWKALAFKHDEDTTYKLVGRHKKITDCARCHPNRVYKPTPRNCGAVGCHAQDDAHKGKLGRNCEKCHRETGENLFNHNTQSVFALDGGHLKVTCKTCHPSITFKPRPKDCFGCHPEPSVHKGHYGTACDECHDTRKWDRIKPIHDVGNFSLTGAHDAVDCKRCHKDSRPLAGTGNLCVTCHRTDDVHGNSLGPKCGDCHGQWSFAPARFDHTTVGCDLQGLHRALPCFDCHKAGNFGALSPYCFGCHWDTGKAYHGGDAGHFECGSSMCHNMNYWRPFGGMNGAGTNSVCR